MIMPDVTLDAGGSRWGQLIVVSHAFSGVNNKGNQRARQEAHVDAKSCHGGAREMYTIGVLDDCIVGGNRVGASPTAWVAILAGLPCLGTWAIGSEHDDKIEQGQQKYLHAGAVFCRFPTPVASLWSLL
jgi:hypothetical protein